MLNRLALLGCLVLASASVRAEAPLRFHFNGSPKEAARAGKSLDRWLKTLAKNEFPSKMRTTLMNQAISRAQFGMTDMRDAVAALPGSKNAAPAPEESARKPNAPCSTLENCPARIGAVHIEEVSQLSGAVASLIRPWILLQHRRGGGLSLLTESKDQKTLMTMTLDGLLTVPVDVSASLAPMGGIDVWLRSEADLDEIYAFSRESVLRAAPPQPR